MDTHTHTPVNKQALRRQRGAGVDFAYLAATRERFHNLFEDAQKI